MLLKNRKKSKKCGKIASDDKVINTKWQFESDSSTSFSLGEKNKKNEEHRKVTTEKFKTNKYWMTGRVKFFVDDIFFFSQNNFDC